jgi:hypothetical protein
MCFSQYGFKNSRAKPKLTQSQNFGLALALVPKLEDH